MGERRNNAFLNLALNLEPNCWLSNTTDFSSAWALNTDALTSTCSPMVTRDVCHVFRPTLQLQFSRICIFDFSSMTNKYALIPWGVMLCDSRSLFPPFCGYRYRVYAVCALCLGRNWLAVWLVPLLCVQPETSRYSSHRWVLGGTKTSVTLLQDYLSWKLIIFACLMNRMQDKITT
jgi:hypothetical protein